MALVDSRGVKVSVGDWLVDERTYALWVVRQVSDMPAAALMAKVDSAFEPCATGVVRAMAYEVCNFFHVCPSNETVDEVIEDYLSYDFNRKFERTAYISFSRRIMRAAGCGGASSGSGSGGGSTGPGSGSGSGSGTGSGIEGGDVPDNNNNCNCGNGCMPPYPYPYPYPYPCPPAPPAPEPPCPCPTPASPVSIGSFLVNGQPGLTLARGSRAGDLSLSWSISGGKVSTLMLTGSPLPAASTSFMVGAGSVSTDTTYRLTAVGEDGSTATAVVSVTFLPETRWGTEEDPSAMSASFVQSLDGSDLSADRRRTVTVDAGRDERIWFAIPNELGEPDFWANGFRGGFVRAGSVNVSGTELGVYKSVNKGLGRVDVEVR